MRALGAFALALGIAPAIASADTPAPSPNPSATPGVPAGVNTPGPGAAPAPAPSASPAAPLAISIFGVGHLSADSLQSGGASSDYMHSSSSRLGITGAYDLGANRAVLFQYETGVDLTGQGVGDGNGGANSKGQLFTTNRDSYVGFKGGFGSVLFGHLGALNQWLYGYNLFADQVGDLGNIWGGDGLPGRLNNLVLYRAPDFGGLSLDVSYAPNEGTPGSSSFIFNSSYAHSGLKLGAAYGTFGQGRPLSYQSATAFTGSYDFGVASVGGGFQHETGIGGVAGANRDKYTYGTAIKVGHNGTAKAQFATATDLAGVPHSGANQAAFGYDYAVAKNTTVYAAYARTANNSLSSYSAFDYGHGNFGAPKIGLGSAPSGASVGVIFKFDAPLVKH